MTTSTPTSHITIGSYQVHHAIAAHITPSMRASMADSADYMYIPADSPCGEECQAIFTAYASIENLSEFAAGTEEQRTAYLLLERSLQAEGYAATILRPDQRPALAEACAQLAAIYMYG